MTSINGLRDRLQEGVGNLTRRVSTGLHTHRPTKRAKVVLEKVKNNLLGRTSPKPDEEGGYHDQQQQQQFQLERPTSTAAAYETYHGNSHPQDMQQTYPPNFWPMSEPGYMADRDMASSPSGAMTGYQDWAAATAEGFDRETYPSDHWPEAMPLSSTPRSRLDVLGELSTTLPSRPDPMVVGGPFMELDGPALQGTQNRRRFMKTVNDTNHFGVVAAGGNIYPTDEPTEPISASPQSFICGKGRPNIRLQTGGKETTASASDQKKKPCPWPGCSGTTASNFFESNRLKEHLRRAHLFPYMCGFPGCTVRKGDKHQISRHRANKHPQAPKKHYKDQDENPLAAAQLQALGERGISYERISQICNAQHVDDLNDGAASEGLFPTEHPPRSAFTSPSPSTMPIEDEAFSVPVSPTSLSTPGHGFHRSLHSSGSAVGTPMSRTGTNSTFYPQAQLCDIVNVLVPHFEQHSSTAPSPTRQARDKDLVDYFNRLLIATRDELEKRERRRSNTSSFSAYQNYTDLLSLPVAATPALTAGTRSLSGSGSYASLRPDGGYAPPPAGFAGINGVGKPWPQLDTAFGEEAAVMLEHDDGWSVDAVLQDEVCAE